VSDVTVYTHIFMRYTKRTFFEERPTIQPLEFRVKSSEMSECHRSYFQRFLWLRNLNHFVMLMAPDISARSKWREDSYSLDLRVHRQSSRFQRASSTAQTLLFITGLLRDAFSLGLHKKGLTAEVWLDLNKTHFWITLHNRHFFYVSLCLIKVRMPVLFCTKFLRLIASLIYKDVVFKYHWCKLQLTGL